VTEETDQLDSLPSIVDRTRPIAAGAPVVAVHFLNNTAVFVLGEEALLFVPRDGDPQPVAVHGGGVLSVACDGSRILTGGDDGRVMMTDLNGTTAVVATDAKRRWIDNVALGHGAVAWSAGKQAFVRADGHDARVLEVPSTVGGLAFFPKGLRLAIAHYNGAALWFPNTDAAPEKLAWKGSHVGARVSPDGRFVITSMQEPTLHGWRIADRKDMRMQGYAARVRSLGFTADGKWLATSGTAQLILWPFQSKDGPMGKTPKMLAPASTQVETVACHPREGVIAAGYADGLVLIVRVDDGAEILAKRPGEAAVTALAWSADGRQLAWGTEAGASGVVGL
jgi:WD40 repeat protein